MYQFWSKKRNIHFGYYRWGMNPFRLEPMLEAMNDFVASQLGLLGETGYSKLETGCSILDIGCGYGATVRHLLRKQEHAKFVGVTKDEEQTKMAKQLGKAKFILADFEEIPLPDESFDAAYGIESFCFAMGHSKSQLIAEVGRLLKPGARLVVVDGFLRRSWPLPFPIRFLYKNTTKAWGMEGLPMKGAFIQSLEKQGFVAIEVKDLSWKIAPSLLHIPRVCFQLLFTYFKKKDLGILNYSKALMLTLLLSPFKNYFGYYAVTCRKSAVRLEN